MKKQNTAKKQERRNIAKKLYKSTKPIQKGLLVASVFSALSIAIALYTPLLLGNIIDEINVYYKATERGLNATLNLDFIQKTSLFLFALYAVSAVCMIIKMYMNNNTVSRHFTCTTRINLSEKLCRLPVNFVDTTSNGEFISRMTNDVSIMGNTVHNVLDLVIQGFLQLIAIAVMMMLINWSMALVVLLIIPFSVIVSTVIAKKSEKHFTKLQEENGKLNSVIEESYASILLIKAYNNENKQAEKHCDKAEVIKNSLEKGSFYSQIVNPIISFTNKIAYIIVCVLGGYLAINGTISVGDVIAIILYSQMLSQPLSGIASSIGMLQHTTVAAKRVYEILDKEEMDFVDCGKEFSDEGNIEFKNVNFSYKKDEPLINDLSFNVKAGQKVAIVGPTGAGKTTIVNLLMRFYDVDNGQILIDGIDIKQMPREKVRQEFAMVLQDTWLFNGTVFDNVAYGKDDATYNEVASACELSYANHFILTLPDGYNTVINDDTTNLSGGQKQLLTIARAFLADRKMLILDEATSNVDTRTEVLIQKAMDNLMKDRTCFVIAHRLSTIVDADLILVIDNGDIVEKGTHSELLEKNGLYATIYNSQYSLIKA